ncbi:MAG: SDR family NAD(P)-dependent oxidoreductase [Paracoccaceae bacterium]|tara:strand:+ start:829 stop:1593 length:765 start_codon:yes stop_codon:yes gene_type:complete
MQLPIMPSFSLKGRSALVVGASSGIGTACAVALAEHGAKVTLAARRIDRLKKIADHMEKKDYQVRIIELDINDINETSENITNGETFDILVNSAGISKHSASKDTSLKDFDLVMNTNLRGAYFLTQSIARKLILEKKPGSLINISSQMGLVGGQERAVYCASKHAVEGFTKAMAIEFGKHKIRINTICPTFILTEMTQKTFEVPEKRKWIEDKIKIGRIGKVEDIMGAVVYLASDASSLVTGSSLLVDGGWTAG